MERRFLDGLREIHKRLKTSRVSWAVVGSTGLALRGVPLDPRDIDLMTDREGAYELERALSEFVTEKVFLRNSERLRSHFGRLDINGVDVEIMGDLRILLPDGTWEKLVDMDQSKQTVMFEGMSLPVLSLECEYAASLKLGRAERADMVRRHLLEKEQGREPAHSLD